MPTNEEIIAALRALLADGEPDGPARKMLASISAGEDALRFGRLFESQWEFWCTPCDEAKYLVAAVYNFVAVIANDDMCAQKLGLYIPPGVLKEFKYVMQRMAKDNWGMDLTKHISPHASTGGTPPISIP